MPAETHYLPDAATSHAADQAKLPSQLPANPEHPTPPTAPDVTLPQAAIDHMSDTAKQNIPFLAGSLAEVAEPPTSFPGAAGDHASDQARPTELFIQSIASFPPKASVTEHPVQNPPPENLGQLLAHPQQ
jgi:hypothetical protein